MKKYIPISCVFYDLLEHYATRKQVVKIVFLSEEQEIHLEGIIVDFEMNATKEEFLVINNQRIRLDYLISVDGKRLADFTFC